MKQNLYQCGIFDLDGVLVDTAKYHYLAWKKLAARLGFDFTEEQNEALKGVSRMRSLEILLEAGGMADRFSEEEKEQLAAEKNAMYVAYIQNLKQEELFPGVTETFAEMRKAGVKIALGSASKNARLILDRLGIASWFDAVIDGTKVTKAKPDPEVFLMAAQELRIEPGHCVVFEDSQAGLEAARRAGMLAVGVGKAENLSNAELIVGSVSDFSWQRSGSFAGR